MNQVSRSGFLLVITMLLFLYNCKKADKSPPETETIKTRVSIVHPSFQDLAEYIQLNGVTLFQKKDNIRSTNTGYVTSLKFRQGDFVKSGQLFCIIVTKEQEALKNISSLDSSLIKFQKPISVFSNGSGVITAINALPGDYVSEGDGLANVNEPSSLVVQVNVPYEYNQYVRAGKACEIILPDGRTIHTAITGVMPSVDASSQSQAFIIRLPNQPLPENLNVTIRITHKQKKGLLCVPSASIQTDEMQKEFWVMSIRDDTVAVKVPIQIGLQSDSLAEIITDKISLNDNIILRGAYGLADSSIVIVIK